MKKIIIILGAIIALAGLYYGVQRYRNNHQDNVKIQANFKGAPCSLSSDCQSGMCENGICKACLKQGSYCTESQNCCSNSCTNNACDKKN